MTVPTRPAPIPPTVPRAVTEGIDERLIRRVVDRFYAQAREDEIIGPVFKSAVPDERWQEHLDTIVDFWSSMVLGTRRYDGRPLRKHLLLPELKDEHFRRWLALFRRTLEELCQPDVAAFWADRAERVGNSFRINVRMHRGEDVMHLKPLEREPYP
ncbi:group III truncated hemoglobin [Chelatococcus sambhunathii]|uniref:Group III truncated hemoglobin n=1 Tax=Chelatococcus sambhunathii TaxID=363953 RepID=A0ABU1DBA8_9HYPH|nr:group III truncated hemoglobin [Chelatococcus sambhunathii]MDR4305394.1 group III truncated hemoglobin [Chelatococcus sambhunathii]